MSEKHEPNEALGITAEIAAALNQAAAEMETGDPDGNVRWDPSSESVPNLHQADIGKNTYARNDVRVSSNSDMLWTALVHREKNADPDIEYETAVERAAEKFNKIMETHPAGQVEEEEDQDDV
jgi:hypothetical protein